MPISCTTVWLINVFGWQWSCGKKRIKLYQAKNTFHTLIGFSVFKGVLVFLRKDEIKNEPTLSLGDGYLDSDSSLSYMYSCSRVPGLILHESGFTGGSVLLFIQAIGIAMCRRLLH